jgi:hypothetical protein
LIRARRNARLQVVAADDHDSLPASQDGGSPSTPQPPASPAKDDRVRSEAAKRRRIGLRCFFYTMLALFMLGVFDSITSISPAAKWVFNVILVLSIVGALVYISVRYYRGGDPLD